MRNAGERDGQAEIAPSAFGEPLQYCFGKCAGTFRDELVRQGTGLVLAWEGFDPAYGPGNLAQEFAVTHNDMPFRMQAAGAPLVPRLCRPIISGSSMRKL